MADHKTIPYNMADQQLALVRYQSVLNTPDNPEIYDTEERNNTQEHNTPEHKKDSKMDQLIQAVVNKFLQALVKVNNSLSQECCQEVRVKHETYVKALQAFDKFDEKDTQVSLADLELIKQLGDTSVQVQEVQGRREQRGKKLEAFVKLVENVSEASSKHIHQNHHQRGVFQQQVNVRALLIGGVAMFLVARYYPRLRWPLN